MEMEIAILRGAYLELLGLPHAGLRARMQPVLAALCNEIAAMTNRTNEEVQNIYEEFQRNM